MRRRIGLEALEEDRLQGRFVFHPQRVGGKARIAFQARNAQRRADVPDWIGLEGADHDQRAILRLEHAGERHRAPVQLISAHHMRGGLLGLRRDHGIEQRDAELLPASGLGPLQQRQQHALHQVHPGRVVREGRGVDGERI